MKREQRQGDPLRGRQALLEESYVNCGIPEAAFRDLIAQTAVFPVRGRTAKANGLPFSRNVFTDSNGVSVVANNCLTCHGTPLFGELVIGLGNEFLDFTIDPSNLAERAGALVEGDEQIAAWELYADRMQAISPYTQTHTVGVNPANNLTFALIAHRDPLTNAWSEQALLPLPPTDPPPVSVPPWWRMAKKPAMFNLGEGRGDHARYMMAASLLCSDSIEELERIDAYAPDIRAYLASLKPPAYPFDINMAQAGQGKLLFVQNCQQCHGSYADHPQIESDYPARLVPIELIQTDDTLMRQAHAQGAAYSDWFNRSFYGQLSTIAAGPGYVAPPLDGIWATAPFLHNGSVPSIRQLLDSSSRARYWQHLAKDASDKALYDQRNLGWSHKRLSQGKPADNQQSAHKYIYDTDLPGYANTGHTFGDHLSDDQRSAVIEYLKTL